MIKECNLCKIEFESEYDTVFETKIYKNICDKCTSELMTRFNNDEEFRNTIMCELSKVIELYKIETMNYIEIV